MFIPGIVAAQGASLSFSQLVLADNPISYWRLDELSGNAIDSGSNGIDFDSIGSAVLQGQTGKVNNAMDFPNSSNAYATVSNNTYGNGAISTATLNVWAFIRALPGSNTDYIFEQQETGGGDTNFRVWITTAGNIVYRTSPGGTATSTGTITLNQWQMLSVVISGGNVNFYIDGNSAGTDTDPGYSGGNVHISGIGNNTATFARSLDGLLDEVACFSTALSQSRLQAYFAAA